jgi:hypothetical protein
MIGYVCDDCLERGEEHLRARLRKAAEHSRQHAEKCEAEAAGPIDLPSIDLYRALLRSPSLAAPTLKH